MYKEGEEKKKHHHYEITGSSLLKLTHSEQVYALPVSMLEDGDGFFILPCVNWTFVSVS